MNSEIENLLLEFSEKENIESMHPKMYLTMMNFAKFCLAKKNPEVYPDEFGNVFEKATYLVMSPELHEKDLKKAFDKGAKSAVGKMKDRDDAPHINTPVLAAFEGGMTDIVFWDGAWIFLKDRNYVPSNIRFKWTEMPNWIKY